MIVVLFFGHISARILTERIGGKEGERNEQRAEDPHDGCASRNDELTTQEDLLKGKRGGKDERCCIYARVGRVCCWTRRGMRRGTLVR